MDISAFRPTEGVRCVARSVFGKATPIKFRVPAAFMDWMIMDAKPRNDEFIVEERVYVVLKCAAGLVLVYADKDCPEGRGFLECENPKMEVEAVLP